MIRHVTITTLAPTGEGVARTPEGVGFVAGALPGEEVDAEVGEVRRRFWKGRAVVIRTRSPERLSGGHAEGCPGCDWAHLPLARAREWKRTLFLDTMERIGELPRELFGELPIAPSPPAYRLRNRFHVSGRGSSAAVGFFAPRTHRVEPAQGCEALGERMRALLPRVAAAVAGSAAPVSQIETVESLDGSQHLARASLGQEADRRDANALLSALGPLFDGVTVAGAGGEVLGRGGLSRLWLPIGGREFPVTAGTFFQTNRFLVGPLYEDVAREARGVPAGRALDAFAGVGLFAGALLDAGHEVVSVEADHSAVELAIEASKRRGVGSWTITRSGVLPYLEAAAGSFDLAVVDPPRAGLGLRLAAALPQRIGRRLVYVSCDPATLARDLAALRSGGLEIQRARLYDFFAFTHRVEAVVTLERAVPR
ncbi:MAG: class I SAM-dependent RNA methyltransferase [Thermoanaerobaculia bacterium]